MSDAATTNPITAKPRGRIRSWLSKIVVGILGLFIVGQIYIWSSWDPGLGPALPILITQAMAVVGTMLLIFWLTALSRWSPAFRLPLAGLLVLGAVGLAASVRTVDFDGNMRANFEFRWDPTREQRLSEVAARTVVGQTSDLLPPIEPADMAEYRGANREGGLPDAIRTNWSDSPPKQLWHHPCGEGYSQFVIGGEFLITQEQRGEDECVVCYRASDGETVWIQKHKTVFSEAMGGNGPRATPTLDDTAVYAQGAVGDAWCLDRRTGEVRWHHNLLTTYLLKNTEWGTTCSPLLIDDLAIFNAGGRDGNGLVAIHRETGDIVWAGAGVRVEDSDKLSDVSVETTTAPAPALSPQPSALSPEPAAPVTDAEGHVVVDRKHRNRPGYSSPMVMTLHGVRQILNFDGLALWSIDPANGNVLWSHPYENGAGVNVAQPLLIDSDHLLLSASYGVGASLIKIDHAADKWSIAVEWPKAGKVNLNLRSKFSNPVLVDGYVYGLDEGILVCLNPKTGDRKWKKGRYGHGQVLLLGQRLLILSEDGTVTLVQPTPTEHKVLGSFQALSAEHKTWNSPAMSRGILYVRNAYEMAAYDLRQ